jgi:uncharacterized protein YabE (DUF348 family)
MNSQRAIIAALLACIVVLTVTVCLLIVHVLSVQSSVTTEQTSIQTIQSRVNTISQELNTASNTGDLITCNDLHNFENDITVSVADIYGNELSGIASSSWLPAHCYKQ